MKCITCGEQIDPKYGWVYHYPDKKDGTRSSKKVYEHIGCSGVIKDEIR